MPTRATLTIKMSRPRADGSVHWYLWIRRPRPLEDELIPVAGYSRREDRPAVERYAEPFREALRRALSEPRPEDANGWFERYTKLHGTLGNGTAQHSGDWARWCAEIVGPKTMTAITSDDIKRIRDGLTRARLDGKISAKRALNIWSTVVKAPLSRAFTDDDPKYADVRVGPFSANPALGVKPPVTKADCQEDERERQALEPAEAAALLSCGDIEIEARRSTHGRC